MKFINANRNIKKNHVLSLKKWPCEVTTVRSLFQDFEAEESVSERGEDCERHRGAVLSRARKYSLVDVKVHSATVVDQKAYC